MSQRPYVTNAEAWKRHFIAMAEGKMDNGGHFYKLAQNHQTSTPTAQSIKVVAPSAQVVEQAKEELNREERQSRELKRSGITTQRKPPSKRAKSKLLKEQEPDLFWD